MSEPKTWSIPADPGPEVVNHVEGKSGRIYSRTPNGGWGHAHTSMPYSWEKLLYIDGPVSIQEAGK